MPIVPPKHDYCDPDIAGCHCRQEGRSPDQCSNSIPTKATDKAIFEMYQDKETEGQRAARLHPGFAAPYGHEEAKRRLAFQTQHSPRMAVEHYKDVEADHPLRRATDHAVEHYAGVAVQLSLKNAKAVERAANHVTIKFETADDASIFESAVRGLVP